MEGTRPKTEERELGAGAATQIACDGLGIPPLSFLRHIWFGAFSLLFPKMTGAKRKHGLRQKRREKKAKNLLLKCGEKSVCLVSHSSRFFCKIYVAALHSSSRFDKARIGIPAYSFPDSFFDSMSKALSVSIFVENFVPELYP